MVEVLTKEKKVTIKDYSLIGEESKRAVERGLAEADWYTAPVPREKMRQLLERKDGPAIIDTLLWFGILGASGYGIYALWGTWWVIIPIMIYSVVYATSSDSRWHESSHGTAFKTDWMNKFLYEVSSFMVIRNSEAWRWSHTRHHSDTIVVGRDPEISAPRPPDIKGMIINLFGVLSTVDAMKKCFKYATGRIGEEEQQYLPESSFRHVIIVARVWVLIYASVIASAIYFQTWLPLFYIGFPTLLGTFLMPIYGLTQHAGLQENVLDHRLNCRTVYMNRIHRFLYWNMNYHLEHHMFPLVPYHNLPELHELIKAYSPKPYNSIAEAWREIIPALKKQVKDPTYYVERILPEVDEADIHDIATTFKVSKASAVDGKVVVCSVDELPKGDVVRLDCDDSTYAVYQLENGKYYATDGICTHGNTHLAEGIVIGDQIECPKHNGRFDVTDGSIKRAPVCVGLVTYPVSIEDGNVLVDIESPGGAGQEAASQAKKYKVVSNNDVATFIKELVLEPLDGEKIAYEPGGYIQLEIPNHATSFADFTIQEPYKQAWEAADLFKLKSANLTKTRRNYSMATNPAVDTQLKFNVRIALPPKDSGFHAGIGSSYVYSLKAGDEVAVSGPYGDFKIKDTQKEMVYIGGGAGMAPLRSQIANLFETQKTKRKVSFWYGARSLQELFYQNYFEIVAEANENFRFEVALSEPKEEDNWDSHTGFIHEVALKEYLSAHEDPTNVEYYLCGPPQMLAACQDMLAKLGVSSDQIAFDDFGGN